jgi:hypothetical protein
MIEIVLHALEVFTTPIVVLVDTPIYEKLELEPDPLIESFAELVVGIVDELVARVE